MKKKLVSALLTAAMLGTMLAGCGGDDGSTGAGAAGNADGAGSSTADGSAGTEADSAGNAENGAEIDFDEEPYEVSIQFVGLFEENNNVANVEAALNEITKEDQLHRRYRANLYRGSADEYLDGGSRGREARYRDGRPDTEDGFDGAGRTALRA